MKKVRWAKDALHDLDQIDNWYADRDPEFADKVGRAAIAAANFLTEYPFAGAAYIGKTRKWPVKGTDYRLIYRIWRDAIEVLRVRHAREDVEKIW